MAENWALNWLQQQLATFAPEATRLIVQYIPLLTWVIAAAGFVWLTKKAAQVAYSAHVIPTRMSSHALVTASETILASKNVTSVTNSGIGDLTINWATAYLGASYQLFITPNGCLVKHHARTPNSVRITCVDFDGSTPADSATLDVLAIGEATARPISETGEPWL